MKLLGIAGSLRKGSYNRGLLRAARELMPEGVELVEFDIRDLPFYDGDVETAGDPEPVVALKDAIREADALLIATPEYNRGVPGGLKNAVDWASRPPLGSPLAGKPVALMGATTGRGGTALAQQQLREALEFPAGDRARRAAGARARGLPPLRRPRQAGRRGHPRRARRAARHSCSRRGRCYARGVNTVRELMTSDVLSVDPSDTIGETAQQMVERGVSSAVVSDYGNLIGIVTERDLTRAVAGRVHSSEARVREWMTADPLTLGTRRDACGRRKDHARQRLPPRPDRRGRPGGRDRLDPRRRSLVDGRELDQLELAVRLQPGDADADQP